MPINSDKPHLWKADVAQSIDFYNTWFLRFAPETYRIQRGIRTREVLEAFRKTENLRQLTPQILQENPGVLPILRMVTAPPLARDRLMGLAYVNRAMIDSMEGKDNKAPRLPVRMAKIDLAEALSRMCDVINELADQDLLPWLSTGRTPSQVETDRAATVIADRLCGATSDPIIRNAQEKRQLDALRRWLHRHGYKQVKTESARDPREMPSGTFTFHLSLPAGKKTASVKIPIDCVVKPIDSIQGELPILIEAKSAGDATNTNKRRKEEAQKFSQLKERYGKDLRYLLLLCGYFEPGYLGYEASEGIDWVWEHRLNDFGELLWPKGKKKDRAVREESVDYNMTSIARAESERLSLQRQIDEAKSQAERNRLGQFSTPFSLACQIMARSIAELPSGVPVSFIEPALGTGVFFSALRNQSQGRAIKEAVGVEVDPAYGDISSRLWESAGFQVVPGDFLSFAQNPLNYGRFNLLCTNPPYVRHQHLLRGAKVELQSRVREQLGLTVSGLSGLYVYFVLVADSIIAEDGIASWLLPAEFLYVNYGRPLREYFTRHVTLLSIHHFDPEDVQFDDALVSSCIATYRKKRPASEALFRFSFGADYEHPDHTRILNIKDQTGKLKWTLPHFDLSHLSNQENLKLGDIFSVHRGIATGANEFFIIEQKTIDQYSIPGCFLKPILPSPRFLTQEVIESDANGMPFLENMHYLLDCDRPPNVVRKEYPGLWSYFQKGIDQGIHKRYLCANRDIWYYQEKRRPSLFLATYMGRSNGNRRSPIRFILNFSKAIATNVYLHLYPKEGLSRLIGNDRSRMLEFLGMLNAIPLEELLMAGRAYGGGLHKVEPKELLEVTLSGSSEWLRVEVTKQLNLI